jgi:hypothetical protein
MQNVKGLLFSDEDNADAEEDEDGNRTTVDICLSCRARQKVPGKFVPRVVSMFTEQDWLAEQEGDESEEEDGSYRTNAYPDQYMQRGSTTVVVQQQQKSLSRAAAEGAADDFGRKHPCLALCCSCCCSK